MSYMLEVREAEQGLGAQAILLEPAPRPGQGESMIHHGELFQGVVEHPRGRMCRALVSLPCELYHSKATFTPVPDSPVVVTPPWRRKARRAAELALESLGLGSWGGELCVESSTPVMWGFGSSTSDVTATLRATAAAFGVRLTPHATALLAVRAELASDATMFADSVVLFAHRQGTVLEEFDRPLPPMEILGFNTDVRGAGVDTLHWPPARYDWWEIEAFRPLLGLLRQAIHREDTRLLANVATASARLNQRFLPTPHFERLEALSEQVQALGLQVAHSGTIAGLLFEPGHPERLQHARHELAALGILHTWNFHTAATRSSP